MNKLIATADGSHTIYVPELNEHYHSIHGAIQESEYVYLKNGFDFCSSDPVHIFEVGFGTGLNALLTAMRCINGKREVFYTSIEKYPLEENVLGLLNYCQFTGKESKKIFDSISSSLWGEMKHICKNFNLKKIKGDIITDELSGSFDLIYFDAFGPDKQPEMWTSAIFAKINNITKTNGILVTYSAKGDVKRILRSSGFDVNLLPGPPVKRHIIRAIKI
ncbi:MAG: tRNA (5-methylaminomethyl-2-thiouridine)(34)-methyltransferase MnmD [Bacteroidia bacterium]|nr:tRNA (5-methylaminomethyl-2-thiouridine)(34)-methyltransferase MnmD [Bacteroidia bacterium]